MKTRAILAVGALAVAVPAGAAQAQAQQPADQPPGAFQRPADVPLIEDVAPPTLSFEGGAGILGYLGGTAGVGPAWNARVSANISPRLALEGNYLGSVNERPVTNTTLVMTSLDGSVRYNLTRGQEFFVQPFVTGGIGYAGWAGTNGDAGALIIPVSAGVERMLTRNIKIGGRINFRPAIFDYLGPSGQDRAAQPGGDTFSLIAHLGGSF